MPTVLRRASRTSSGCHRRLTPLKRREGEEKGGRTVRGMYLSDDKRSRSSKKLDRSNGGIINTFPPNKKKGNSRTRPLFKLIFLRLNTSLTFDHAKAQPYPSYTYSTPPAALRFQTHITSTRRSCPHSHFYHSVSRRHCSHSHTQNQEN